ncbi:hypothetical protein XELAEV_18024747mg [Xenopus laevis]|uniref:Helix-turn-helix domain-containing protein n=1 Tax=Xenopus laevis TaxID=8355 RepID=A0A974HLP5_XENLA|nr:hypothetical protein XELAEV_18024747mg [Xenopus laevis]
MATNTLLRAESHHPESLITGIPIGQFLHIRRNCTYDDDFENQATDLAQRLKSQVYNNQWRDIQKILKNNWDLLVADPDIQEVVGPFPRMTARRAPSLRDKLTNSHFVNSTQENVATWLPRREKGMFKCGHCKCCKFIYKCSGFSHF